MAVEPLYLTRTEAARALRISTRHLDALIKRGRLPAVRLGAAVRVPAAAVRPDALPPARPENSCTTSPLPLAS